MITLIAFSQEQPAQLLLNYLRSNNIEASYVKREGEFLHTLILKNESQLELAKQIVEEFVNKPTDKKYQQAAWSQGKVSDIQSKTSLWNGVKPLNFSAAPFTNLVLILCLGVFFVSLFGGFRFILNWFQILPFDEMLQSHQWWRVVGPAFIHFSELHLIFNLLWWWSLGSKIEQKFGTSTLVILFLVSAITSNLGQLFTSGTNFGGLSGVVYAVVGFVWWMGWLRPQWGLSLPKPVVGFLLVWLVLGYADVLWVNMANTAHTVGLIAGCLSAVLYVRVVGRQPG